MHLSSHSGHPLATPADYAAWVASTGINYHEYASAFPAAAAAVAAPGRAAKGKAVGGMTADDAEEEPAAKKKGGKAKAAPVKVATGASSILGFFGKK